MRAKICGCNTWEDVAIALNAGADAIGFLVGITHLAEDKVSCEDAQKLIEKLPPFVSKVAVTHLQKADDIIPMMRFLNADTLQLHNDIREEEIRAIRNALPYLKIIKSVSVTGDEAVEKARSFEKLADAIILDSRTADRLGGTGLTHDWRISRQIVRECGLPVILAGGLKPENLQEAIDMVHPYAVDVNSGVETAGRKDAGRVKAFVEIAHRNAGTPVQA